MADWVGPAVTATLISSLIAALGWYVSWRTATGLDGRRRSERVLDVQTALLAEIGSIVHHLEQYDSVDILTAVTNRLQTDETYTPFISKEVGSPLYNSIAGEISILPNSVINDVVLFYRQQQVIAYFAEDLRGERFSHVPKEQKIAMIEDYLALRDFALSLGRDAVAALRRSIDAGFSRRGEGRSDPRSASASAGA
ncbi:hypothetical protein Sa4125_34160 [Aureimonas sp. SA4125]|uniref:hypothetical protein n=1 Tax=Aureimonas sp. SA4125 TaxID=2826993 RepID=UPI001CC36C6E|nr:hypothetical protein [Aureimonas sp. SA4125]BDA85874.1 hypothetical protein Sa4125_34160 [Aureimonas sp. SA4125]